MKKIIFTLGICLCMFPGMTQSLGINATGAAAATSSILDVSSTDKGMLVPRMSKTERNNISTPATGLLVFQNAPDSAGFYYYDGGKWNWLAALNGNADTVSWKRNGNAGTNPTVNFIGTTDNQALQMKVNNIKAGLIDHQKKNVLLGTRAALYLSTASVGNTIIGDSAFYADNQTLTDNVVIGYGAQSQSTLAANDNTVVGWNAGKNNIGSWTTIIGTEAGQNNKSAGNVFVGSSSGKNNTTGALNSFLGDNSGRDDSTGSGNSFFGSFSAWHSNGNENSFFGKYAGFANLAGSNNVFVGSEAGYSNTGGSSNIGIGYRGLSGNQLGSRNVAIGNNSLVFENHDSLNIAIGDSAAYSCFSSRNISIGSKSGRNLFSGQANTIIGDNASYSMSSGDENIFIGNDAAKLNSGYAYRSVVIGPLAGDSSVASWSTIIGNLAGTRNKRQGNTMLGSSSGQYNSTGIVTLLGDNTGRDNTTGDLIAVGFYAGSHNTIGTGNTFTGFYSGLSNTKGAYNSFYGSLSGNANDSGSYNSYFGLSAGFNNVGGSYNSVFGSFSAQGLKSSNSNTVIGYSAFSNGDTSSGNSILGANAAISLRKADNNSIFGNFAGIGLVDGNENVLSGYLSGLGDTSNYSIAIGSIAGSRGNENIFIGHRAGGSLINTLSSTNSVYVGSMAGYFRHSSNTVLLGYNSNLLIDGLDNATAIGANARVDVSNAMVLGNSNVNVGMGVTTPTHAKLTLYADAASGTPLSIFGYGQNGISIQQNWPTIGYNQYRDLASANSAKYMGNGYAWVNTMEPSTGNIYWNSMPFGTPNATGGTETNRMTLTNSGFLGLNNSSPHAVIQVDNQLNNRRIVLWEQNNNSTEFFGFGINSGVLRYQVPNANSGNAHVFYAANSTLLSIFGNGNATLAGTLTQLSDARLKKDIIPIKNALAGLNKLNAYNYYWIDETKDKDLQTGLLAQEVEQVYPQLVKKNNDGLLSVNYSGFIPLLIKGMQEQQQTIDDLKKEVDEMRQMIKNMATGK